eukprot:scaffold20425_cov70-Phaeocystis_antarctica.AAC.3
MFSVELPMFSISSSRSPEHAPGDATCTRAHAPSLPTQNGLWWRAQRQPPRDCRKIRVTGLEARVRNKSWLVSNPRWPSWGRGAVRPDRALCLRAPQHHSSLAASSDHTQPTMPPRRRRERDACRTEVRSIAPQARRMAPNGHMSDCAQYGRTARSACALLSATAPSPPHLTIHSRPCRREGGVSVTHAVPRSARWRRKPAGWHPMAICRTARSTAAPRALPARSSAPQVLGLLT